MKIRFAFAIRFQQGRAHLFAVLARHLQGQFRFLVMMRAATDGLARLFSVDDPLARFIRNSGMAAIDRIAPLKNLLIRQALG